MCLTYICLSPYGPKSCGPVVCEIGGIKFQILVLTILKDDKLVTVETHIIDFRPVIELFHFHLELFNIIFSCDFSQQLAVIHIQEASHWGVLAHVQALILGALHFLP